MSQLDLLYILKWWTIFLFIGISFLPLTHKVFSKFIDRGYIFSKVFGVLLISYSIYVLGTLRLLQFSALNILLVWIILIIVQLLLLRHEKFEFGKTLKIFIIEEFIFFLALLLWSLIRSYNPDIHDLEKFMDYGFINSILRSEYFPPRDIWLSPFSINYYYFGHLYTAVITKLTQIPSFITFNLMLATLFAFTFSLSFSLGVNLVQAIKKHSIKKSFLFGLFFGYIVTFSGNIQTIYSFFKSYNGESPVPFWDLMLSISTFPNSYWYPNATRFIYHTIHEFPSYSFVVADLHGHVLGIPIIISLIAIAFVILLEKKIRVTIAFLISFLISLAYMTNAWDALIYFGLFVNILIFMEYSKKKNGKFLKKIIASFINSLRYILLIVVSFFVFTFVFNQNFSPFASGIGLNCSPNFLVEIEHFGPFLFEKGQCQLTPIWKFLILYGFFFYMIGSFIIFLRRKKLIISDYFILIISFISILLIITPEILYLKDIYTGHFRANTMFKLSYQAFIMLSISSVYILIRILTNIGENSNLLIRIKAYFKLIFKPFVYAFFKQIPSEEDLTVKYTLEKKGDIKINPFSKLFFFIFITGSTILLFLVSIYPYFAIPSGYGDLKKYKGLSGINYLKETKPGDFQAIIWINKNVKNQPVILEAQGDSYTDFARISANTGLPTVLGWTVHEWLWRGSYDIPSARFSDIQNLYETKSVSVAKRIIKKYKVSLIYIGDMENEKYKVSEGKFSQLGQLIYKNLGTKIYKIH